MQGSSRTTTAYLTMLVIAAHSCTHARAQSSNSAQSPGDQAPASGAPGPIDRPLAPIERVPTPRVDEPVRRDFFGTPARLPRPLPFGNFGVRSQLGVPSSRLPLDRTLTVPKPAGSGTSTGLPGVFPTRGAYFYDNSAYTTPVGMSYPTFDPFVRDLDPKPAPMVVDERPVIERAAAAITLGDPAAGETLLRALLRDDPDDALARRLLGLALIDLGRVKEGVREVYDAYTRDPRLSRDPLRRSAASDEVWRRRFARASDLAGRGAGTTSSDQSLIVASIIAQSQQRFDIASRTLTRIRDTKTHERVLTPLQLEIDSTIASAKGASPSGRPVVKP